METGNREYMNLPLDALKPYPGHIFAPYDGERLDGMVESVKEHGVITPIICRKVGENEYEILSGHNRVKAAETAGLTEIKAVVHMGLKNDEAEFIVTETNLMQRSFADLKHSERARALKNHLEAVQKSTGGRGFRSDLVSLLDDSTLNPVDSKLDSFKKVADQYAFSKATVVRYVRLAKLPSELLALVDAKRIPVRAALDLSFLPENEMSQLTAVLAEKPRLRVTQDAGGKLREEKGQLSKDRIVEILENKPATAETTEPEKKIKRVSMSAATLEKLNERTSNISGAVERIVEFYFRGLASGEFGDILSEIESDDADGNETDEIDSVEGVEENKSENDGDEV